MTGAVIALAVKQPAVALPLAFLSHYALDALPHFGYDRSIFERNKKKLFWTVLGFDAVLTVVVMGIAFFQVLTGELAWPVLAGMLAAFAPDGAWIYRFAVEIRTKKFAPPNRINAFHAWIQWCERPWGLVVEIVWLVLVVFFFKQLA